MAIALALRDRALVETAYAAGLRISELAAADLGSLDLRRGEIRVIGKGRKERIGLLGRPALAALGTYLDHGRPILLDRRPAAERPRPDRGLPQPPRRAARGPWAALPARPPVPPRRPAPGRVAPHAPAFLRDAPARRRGGPARRPGAARAREPGDDPDLHARVARPPGGRLPRRASARPPRGRAVTAARTLARAGMIVSGAFLFSRVLGWVRLVVIGNALPTHRSSTRSSPRSGCPDLMFQLVAAGALSSALIPVLASVIGERRRATRVARRVDGHEPHAHRADRAWRHRLRRCRRHRARLRGRLRRADPGPHDRADPDHGAQPDLPGPGRGGDQRAQRTRPVRGRRGRAERLQPRDHRRGVHAGSVDGCRRARHRGGRRVARPSAGPAPAVARHRVPLPAAHRYRRRGRPEGPRAHGAAGDRPRGDADHVPRGDRAWPPASVSAP